MLIVSVGAAPGLRLGTARAPAGIHLPARGFRLLLLYLDNGMAGSDPLDRAIVVPPRAMAEAAVRPLPDIGAQVRYLPASGIRVVLEPAQGGLELALRGLRFATIPGLPRAALVG